MKNHADILDNLEKVFNEEINSAILNLVSVKFSKKISEIAKVQIKDMIHYHIEETIWINEIKANLNKYIFEYTESLREQKGDLNLRMDHIEQLLLNLTARIDHLECVRR